MIKKAPKRVLKEGMDRISFTYPKSLKDKIVKLAQDDGRSLSGYIQRVLEKHIEKISSTTTNKGRKTYVVKK